MLETVVQYGTGRAAAIGQFAAGKTGTTSNYGDAWFVGWNSKYTVAVWVGYPNKLIPMTTAFNGQPVLGGTFPALIWHSFMNSALQIEKERAEHAAEGKAGAHVGGESATGSSETSSTPSTAGSTQGESRQGTNKKSTAKRTPAPSTKSEETGTATPSPEHPSTPVSPTPPTPREAPSESPSSPTAPATSSPSPTGGVSPSG